MLSPDDFETEYPPAELDKELPASPVTSLRSIQYLYGKLYTLATAGGGDYASYLTPDAARDLVDKPDSLIVVRVDLSGDAPQLAEDDRGPVWVTKYTDERVRSVGHCKYPAARGIDHSITHQAGRNSEPDKLARYAKERLSKWPTDDTVQDAASDHPDGWMVEALATLGDDEAALDEIDDALHRNLTDSTTALLTVQVKLDADGHYEWPGDVGVFNSAMRERKLSKLRSKGKATNSVGDATDLVTGEETRAVGTAEDPLNFFLGKQLEKFPGLDPDEAWRNHPISEDAAVTVMNAETFVDACTYRTFGARVYCLPYLFGQPTPEDAYTLYRLLHAVATASDDDRMTPIERAYQKLEDESVDENRLRFHVSAIMPHQMSRYDVFGETMNALVQYPASLAIAHQAVLKTAAFRDSDTWSAAFPTNENWSLLNDNAEYLNSITTGWYFAQTFPEGDDDTDASADDPRIQALVAVLAGDSIPVSMLLSAFVERIIAESGDDDHGFPSFLVASQYAQLCALATAKHDFLTANAEMHRPITESPAYEDRSMTVDTDPLTALTDGGYNPREQLESFIDATPALANDERRASFLLGGLVGAVGNYQEYHEDRSTTLVDQFPVKSITRNRIKKVTQDTIGKTLTYTRQEKKQGQSYPGTKFDYLVDELRAAILEGDPSTWTIETEDLRFYYALGITYGMNDRPSATAESDDETEAVETDAEATSD
jgi:CRISPR-associated protein Cas8b/Csh1 subtype I-B